MAWDAPRRSPDGLPFKLERHLLRVDEVKINNSQTLHSVDTKANMRPPLSPIHEETAILAVDAPLQVTVTVRFHDPAVRSVYSRTYFSSHSFRPTERICRGLLRRISHCSQELLTRNDSDALNPTQCLRKGPKQLRFELAFEIHREGHSDPWGWSTFKSYQKHAVTRAAAKDVVRSTHTMVGMFLARHDKNFKLTDDPIHEYFPERPETSKPSPVDPLGLICVPRSRFIEPTQTWEFVPGYSLELVLNSSNPARHCPEIRRISRIDSIQSAPLNLGLGEDLLWQAYRSLQDVLDQKKNVFDLEHASCDGISDCDCQHFDEDALRVELRVVNNLGPTYDHLSRMVQSRFRLFSHPTGQDCDDFVLKVAARLKQFRDRTDKKVEKLNDFDFRITELTGHGWQENNAARFIINGKQNHSRRTIEALLDRIRTSTCEVLRGYDVAVRMVAYKRGHLILDKALISRNHQPTPYSDSLDSTAVVKEAIVAELKTRIDSDIKMICEDTCNLEDESGAAPATPERTPQRIRPCAVPDLPPSPRSFALQPQRWTLPGSPGSFATRPRTPPQVPPRMLSTRVFPLVPAKYRQKKERAASKSLTARDSAVGMGFDGDYPVPTGAANSESLISLRVPPAVQENRRENAFQNLGNNALGLRPAAEVYPALKTVDCETDSNSTHSSLPALTESDSPSPEPNMLVTPNCARSASPSRRGLAFHNGPPLHLSGSSMLNFSAPNSASLSEVECFTDLKIVQPLPSALHGQPLTPSRAADTANLPLVDTPKTSFDCCGDDKTPLAHRQMHGPTSLEVIRESGTEHSALNDTSVTNRCNSQRILPLESESEPETDCFTAAAESSKPAQGDQPVESSLLPCCENESQLHQQLHEACELVNATATVAQCDSSETLTPSAFSKQRPIDNVAHLRLRGQSIADDFCDQIATSDEANPPHAAVRMSTSAISSVVPSPVRHRSQDNTSVDEAEFSAPIDEFDNISSPEMTDAAEALTMDDELSRAKSEFSEQDGDSAIGSEGMDYSPPDATVPDAEMRSVGMSESSEAAGHVIPFSDSGVDVNTGSDVSVAIGPEVHESVLRSPVDKNISRVDDFESGTRKGSDLLESELAIASVPSDRAFDRVGANFSAEIPYSLLHMESQAFEIPHDDLETVEQISPAPSTAPIPHLGTLTPPKTGLLGPAFETYRSVSNSSHAHVGLGNSLLPALPIFGSLTTNDAINSTTRDSWSSSSSWEGYESTGRQSSDSVDTARLSPLASDEEESHESPKRLGTPTAGLLGLHESRWAELGLRTALTGTHAFDRPFTAPLSDVPNGSDDETKLDAKYTSKGTAEKYTGSSLPSKAFHLRPRTSAGSLLAGSLNKKGSRNLKKKESKDMKKHEKRATSKAKASVGELSSTKAEDESASRFPRAMMLVAGLAFASSIVSRNHS